MRYAIINTRNNVWEFETDSLQEAQNLLKSLRRSGVECVLVEILDAETNIFDE
jgi:hypothetical protein